MTYRSPYGRLDAGLRDRLAGLVATLRTDRQHPFIGLGALADLELIMSLLNKREFLDWLHVHGPDDQRRFAEELRANVDTAEACEDAAAHAEMVPTKLGDWPDPVQAIEALDKVAQAATRDYDAVREVLVDVGALEADDADTPVADLLRALLS